MQDILFIWQAQKETTKKVAFHVRTLCPAYGDIMVLGTKEQLFGFHHKGVPIQPGFIKQRILSQDYLVRQNVTWDKAYEDVPFSTFVLKVIQRLLPVVVASTITSFLSDFALVRETSFRGELPSCDTSLMPTSVPCNEGYSLSVFMNGSLHALGSHHALSFRLMSKNVHSVCAFDAFSAVVGQTNGQVHLLHISWEEKQVLCKIALPRHWDPVTWVTEPQ